MGRQLRVLARVDDLDLKRLPLELNLGIYGQIAVLSKL